MLPTTTTTTTKYTSSGQISTSRTFLLDDDHNNANLKANIGGCNNNSNSNNSNSKNRSNSNSSTRKTIANSFNSSTNNINNHNHYRHHHYKQQNNNKNIVVVDGNNLSNNCRSDEVLVVIDEHTTTTTTPSKTTPKSKNAEVEVEEELELILASNKPQPIDTTTNCNPNITTTNNNQRNISLTTTTNNTNNTTTKSVGNCKNNKQTDVVRLTNRYCSLNNITENNAENSSRHTERPEDPIKSFYFNLSDLEDRPPTRTSANSCYCSSSSNSSSATGCIGCCSTNISTTSNTSNQTTGSSRTTTNQRSLSILDKYSTKQREFNAARKYHQLEKLLLLSLSSSSLVSSSSSSSSSNRSAFSPATATNSSSSSSSTSPPLSSSSNTDTTSASTSSSLFLVPPNRIDTYRLGDIIPTAVVQPTTVNSIPPPPPTYDDVPIVYVSKKSICLENSIKTSSGGNQAQRYHLRKQVSLTNLPSSTSSNNTTSGIGTISTISDTTSSSSSSSNTNLSTNTVVKIPKIAAAKSELLLSQAAAVNTKQHITTNEQKQQKEETKEIVIKNSNRYTTPSSQTKQTANILNNPATTSEENTSCNTTATPNNSSSGGGGGEAGGGGGGGSSDLGSGISRAANDTLEPIVSIVKELETNIKSTLMNQHQNQNTNMMNILPQISTNNNRTKDLQQKTSGEDTTSRSHTTSSKDKVAIPILKPPICNIVNNSNTTNTKKSKTYTVNNSETSTTVLASSIETDKTKIITFNAALIQQKSLLKKYNPPIKIPTHPNDDIHQQGTNSLLSVYEFDDNLVLSSHVDKLVAAMTTTSSSGASSSDERLTNESNKKASNPVTNNSSNTAENSNSKFNPINSISSDNKCTTTISGANNCQFIVSRHGTVRGSLNHVKTSLKQIFKEPHITSPVVNPQLNITPSNNYYNYNCATVNTKVNEKLLSHYYLARNYEEEEDKKIIIYTTSLQIVRLAYDKCKRVKKILQNHCVRYEERDLYKNREYQRELKYRLNINQVDVPHVFFNGKHVGNCDQLELYSDQGVLNELFKDLEKIKLRIYCSKCGGYRFVLCTLCNGSKKKFNNFTNLKCTACNEDGLVRCSECLDQQE